MTVYKEKGDAETVSVPGRDPYYAECIHIFDCLERGQASSLMDIRQACRSLEIALAAQEALRSGGCLAV
jgi:predicted dehydrogenase